MLVAVISERILNKHFMIVQYIIISERILNKHFMIVQYIELIVQCTELIATIANKMLRKLE